MGKPSLTILFLISITLNFAFGQQSDTLQKDFFKQYIDELKMELDSMDNYKSILVKGQTLSWNTSSYKGFLVPIDTSNYKQIEIKHGPTRRKIKAFMELVDNDDYQYFKDQLDNHLADTLISPITLKGNKNGKYAVTVSLTSPIMNKDKSILIIREFKQYTGSSSSWSDKTKVYVYSGTEWQLWDIIRKSYSAIN